jgi:fucose 4-O-acetylase-like acetyltransferase
MPLPFATYFTRDYGANFTLIPWLGFSLYGALLGYILSKNVNIAFNYLFTVVILILGILLHLGSGGALAYLYKLTGDMNLKYLLYNNFLFYHLGNTLIVCGVISFIANTVKIPVLLAKAGQKTMMIYVVHVFIIYGTWLNHGLIYYYKYSFEPWLSILSAVLLIIFFLVIVNYIDTWKAELKKLYHKFFKLNLEK